MHWLLLVVAVGFFVAWIILHFVLGLTPGVFNLFWMMAILFAFLWGAQWAT